jgi:diguanylate cyclase (GGDEF)-like protein
VENTESIDQRCVGDHANFRSLPSGEDSQLLLRTEELGLSLLELLRECREQVFQRRPQPVATAAPENSKAENSKASASETVSFVAAQRDQSLGGSAIENEQVRWLERLGAAEGTLAEFMQAVRRFHDLARSDALTGLPNRRAFDDHVDRMVADTGARPVSLVLMDIDGFKQINDRFGHGVGDRVLRYVGDCLRAGGGEDAMVARFGGEEFSMLVCESGEMAMERVDRCRRVLESRSGEWSEIGLSARFSAGVAELRSEERVGDWFRRSDLALYAAKRLGGDRVVLHDGEFLKSAGDRFEFRACLADGVAVADGAALVEGYREWHRAERGTECFEGGRIEVSGPGHPDRRRGTLE